MAKTIVDWKTISSFVTDAFVGVGVPREDAEICTDVLLESDRRGMNPTESTVLSPFILTALISAFKTRYQF